MQTTTTPLPLPLHLAILTDDHQRIIDLLEDVTINISEANSNGTTPLHLAVSSNRAEFVQLLLRRGADREAIDKVSGTPLNLARLLKLDPKIIELLTNEVIPTVHPNERAAAETVNVPEVSTLVTDDIGDSSSNIIAPLIDGAIDPRTTALHEACEKEDIGRVKILLADNDLDINAQDSKNDTAFHIAVRSNNVEIVHLFLHSIHKINFDLGDNENHKSIDIANNKKNQEIVNLIFNSATDFLRILPKGKHVGAIRFPQRDGEWHIIPTNMGTNILFGQEYPSLINMTQWGGLQEAIPKVSIITSPNGFGKSQLLNYIYSLLGNSQNEMIFHMDANFMFAVGTNHFYDLPLPDENRLYDQYVKCLKYLYSIEEKVNTFIEIMEVYSYLFPKIYTLVKQSMKEEYNIDFENLENRQEVIIHIINDIQKESLSYDKFAEFLQGINNKLPKMNLPPLFNTDEFDLLEEYKKEKFLHPLKSLHLSSEHKEVLNFLEDQINLDLRFKKKQSSIEQLKDDELKLIMKKIVQETLNKMKLTDPESFLAYIFNAYRKHKASNIDEPLADIDPSLEKINRLLEKHKLGYKIGLSVHPQLSKDGEYVQVKFVKDGESIKFTELSSGEKTIFSLIAWQFAAGESSRINNTVKVMLLDEPDKHLDPRFCKIFFDLLKDISKESDIQIIMTTHKVDTVALIPDDKDCQIFSISREKDKNPSIEPITKLRALFRLTQNMLPMTSLPINVYTENANDAFFYSVMYEQLRKISEDIKTGENQSDDSQPKSAWEWVSKIGRGASDSSSQHRVVSRRISPQFLGVSNLSAQQEREGEGKKVLSGHGGVVTLVSTDARHCSTKSSHLFALSKEQHVLFNPFGIIDNDNDGGEGALSGASPKARKNIIVLKRHSLENFLLDPLFLPSVLSDDNLIKNDAFRRVYQKCVRFVKEIISTRKLENQDYINEYFSLMISELYRECDIRNELCQDAWEYLPKLILSYNVTASFKDPNTKVNYCIEIIREWKRAVQELVTKESKDKKETKKGSTTKETVNKKNSLILFQETMSKFEINLENNDQTKAILLRHIDKFEEFLQQISDYFLQITSVNKQELDKLCLCRKYKNVTNDLFDRIKNKVKFEQSLSDCIAILQKLSLTIFKLEDVNVDLENKQEAKNKIRAFIKNHSLKTIEGFLGDVRTKDCFKALKSKPLDIFNREKNMGALTHCVSILKNLGLETINLDKEIKLTSPEKEIKKDIYEFVKRCPAPTESTLALSDLEIETFLKNLETKISPMDPSPLQIFKGQKHLRKDSRDVYERQTITTIILEYQTDNFIDNLDSIIENWEFPSEDLLNKKREAVVDNLVQRALPIKYLIPASTRTIEINYPKVLLDIRGHNLEYAFTRLTQGSPVDPTFPSAAAAADSVSEEFSAKEKNIMHEINRQVQKIDESTKIITPTDLVETLLSLDEKMRNQVNQQIKNSFHSVTQAEREPTPPLSAAAAAAAPPTGNGGK